LRKTKTWQQNTKKDS